jgi:hypothetical protein
MARRTFLLAVQPTPSWSVGERDAFSGDFNISLGSPFFIFVAKNKVRPETIVGKYKLLLI